MGNLSSTKIYSGLNYSLENYDSNLYGKEQEITKEAPPKFVHYHKLVGDIGVSTKCALERVQFEKIVPPGNYVAIKVNLGGGVTDIPASGSDPRIARAVAEYILDHGGKPVVVEANNWGHVMDGRLLQKRHYLTWLRELNVPFLNLSRARTVHMKCVDHPVDLLLCRFLLYPKIPLVNIAPLKHHWECGITAAEKNLYGAISDERKSYFHRDMRYFDHIVASAARIYNPDLNILGGVCVCAGQGPHFCQPIRFGHLILSNDMIAADFHASKILGYPFSALKYAQINLKQGNGYWKADIEETEDSQHPPSRIVQKFHKLAFSPKELVENRSFFSFVYNFPPRFLRSLRWFEFVIPRLNRALFASRERQDPCPSRY